MKTSLNIKIHLTNVDEDYKWYIYRLLNQLHYSDPDNFNYRTIIGSIKYEEEPLVEEETNISEE